ncbi:MAG: hypothetical protein E7430_08550 [Ruminococcaceae bacterium]|nr:hypothetical protein [Oscillospiraceae bacterium]
MELPVSLQSWQFCACLLAGLALAAIYDILKMLRRLTRLPYWPMDIIFSLVLLLTVPALALYVGGGDFRLFFFPALVLGAVFWFITISPLFSAVMLWIGDIFGLCVRILTVPVRALKNKINFLIQKSKNIFQFIKKCYTIKKVTITSESLRLKKGAGRIGTFIFNNKTGPAGSGDLRSGVTSVHDRQNPGRSGRKRKPDRPGGGRQPGKRKASAGDRAVQ